MTNESKTKSPTKSAKRTKKKAAEKTDFRSFMAVSANLLRAYGEFAESLGQSEKEHRDTYKMFTSGMTSKTMELIPKFVSEAPPQVVALFMKVLLQMSTYGQQINNLMTLSAEGKIELGKNLKSLAGDLLELEKIVAKEARKE